MRKLNFFSFILAICTISMMLACSSDDGDETPSEFQGNWNGTFEGDDTGTWVMNIDSEGEITGDVVSDLDGTFTVRGAVQDNGTASATAGTVSSGAIFSGTFNGDNVSGTWQNVSEGDSGIWSGSRN